MHCFFSYKKLENRFILDGEELRHIKVRRVKPGDLVGVIYENSLYLCKVESIFKDKAVCLILERIEPFSPPVNLILYQCVPVHIKTFEVIVQKATELGVSTVIPVISSRSFQDARVISSKMPRWEKIVKEAMKQANRAEAMEISEVKPLENINPICDLNLLLDNFSAQDTLNCEILKGINSVSVVVGPEGGFSEEEVKTLISKGFKPVRLRNYILKSETASVVVCGAILNFANS